MTRKLLVSADRAPKWNDAQSVLYFGLRDPHLIAAAIDRCAGQRGVGTPRRRAPVRAGRWRQRNRMRRRRH